MASARIYTSVTELPSAYERLFAEGGGGDFFSSRAWYENFAETALGPGERPLLYAVEGTDEPHTPLTLLPMKARTDAGVVRGRALSALSNYYTPLFGPLLAPTAADPAGLLRQLAASLRAARPRWDYLDLHPLSRDAATFSQLLTALRSAGFVVQTYFCFGNWYLEVAGRSWAEYAESLPSRLRNTLRRKRRSLEKAGRLRFDIVTGADGLDAAIQGYERVYRSSWKHSEPYPHFLPGLIRTCAREGSLRLGLLHLDGEVVAAQVWIVSGGTASIYKLAYDEAHAKLSVGSILSAHLFEHVLDVDKVDVVDYLSGDDGYKRDWMSQRRERWGVVAFNPGTVHGLARALRNVGGRALKTAWLSLLSVVT